MSSYRRQQRLRGGPAGNEHPDVFADVHLPPWERWRGYAESHVCSKVVQSPGVGVVVDEGFGRACDRKRVGRMIC